MGLRRADLESVLAFVGGDAVDLDFDALYPIDFLVALQRLVPSCAVVYQVADHRAMRFSLVIEAAADGGQDAGEAEADEADEVYWSLGPCPTQAYRERSGDLSAMRTSDLVDLRHYRETALYREYFHPAQIEHIIDVGLPARRGQTRSLLFFRDGGMRDFSQRDVEVLELLRPHLRRIEAHIALRRELREACDRSAEHHRTAWPDLTPREREIVELVAEGRTNAEIGALLWVAPSTVKKHLENVYAKTGIGRRAAAAAGMIAAHP